MVETESDLREIIGSPAQLVTGKVSNRLNDIFRDYIERSPFVCVASVSSDGALDVSPRGDPAGFVRILDEHTLLIPERPGNRIADTLVNVLATGRIGLLFLVPGVGDTFRVNGSARIVDDAELLSASTVDGKAPRLGLLVTVEEAYTQCSKALIRSDLWNPARHVDPKTMPTSGQMLKAVSDPTLDVDEYERARAERYRRREGLY
jgi:PPOX class probable FMN-dependent enzyme